VISEFFLAKYLAPLRRGSARRQSGSPGLPKGAGLSLSGYHWPMPDDADPQSAELETQLRVRDPAAALAYTWAYADHSAHCRRDPDWRARIEELKRQLSRAF
jgi:hypothetical protein